MKKIRIYVMSLNSKQVEYLSAEFVVSGDTIKITGMIDSASPGDFLRPFLSELHDDIVKNKLKKVNVDITGLSYLNSSSIKEIVTWIIMQKSMPEEKAYDINFLCNSEYMWQESSVSTVAYLNPGHILKEII